MPEFTDDQIERGIRLALERQDVKAIPGLITLLAIQNPRRADAVRQTILYGLDLAAKKGETDGRQ